MPTMPHLLTLAVIVRQAIQRHSTYRAAAFAGLVTNFFFGLLRVALYLAILGGGTLNGMGAAQAITYTALAQSLIAIVNIFGRYDLMQSIDNGQIASDLLRPISLFEYWLAQDLGRAVVAFVLRGVTIIFLFSLLFPLVWPTTPLQWLAFALSLFSSWLVSFGWWFLVNLAAFWSPNALGFGRFAFSITWVISGLYLPLRFFPDWARALCYLTPFPGLINTPIEIFTGLLTGPQAALAIGHQLLWAALLIAIGQLVLRAGIRRLVIQGG